MSNSNISPVPDLPVGHTTTDDLLNTSRNGWVHVFMQGRWQTFREEHRVQHFAMIIASNSK